MPSEWGTVFWPQRNEMCVDPAKVTAEEKAFWNALPTTMIKWKTAQFGWAVRLPWGGQTGWCINAVKPSL